MTTNREFLYRLKGRKNVQRDEIEQLPSSMEDIRRMVADTANEQLNVSVGEMSAERLVGAIRTNVDRIVERSFYAESGVDWNVEAEYNSITENVEAMINIYHQQPLEYVTVSFELNE